MMGGVRILSDDEWRALHETYYAQGFTLLECATMVFCDRHTVARNFTRLGLEVRRRGPRSQQWERLPKWARDHIEALERELASEREKNLADAACIAPV